MIEGHHDVPEEASRFSAEEVGRLNVSRRQSDRELIEGGATGHVDQPGMPERLVPTKKQIEHIKYTDSPEAQSARRVAAQAENSLEQAAREEKDASTESAPAEFKSEISPEAVEQTEADWKIIHQEVDDLVLRFRDEVPDSEISLFSAAEEFIDGTRAGYLGTVITAKQYCDSLVQAKAVVLGIKRRMNERHRQ